MLNKAREALLLFLMLLVLPLAANAQQLVALINGDRWREIIKVESSSSEQLIAISATYIQKAGSQIQSGDRSNGLTNALIGLSILRHVQNRQFDQRLNDSVKRVQKTIELAGVEQSVIIASEGTLTSYLNGQSTALAATHQYNVTAVDVAGRPLAGVVVEVQLAAKDTSNQTMSCTTDESGHCLPISYVVNRDWSQTHVASFSSTAKAKGTKHGYYSTSVNGSKSGIDGLTELRLDMIHPVDYLDDGFAASTADRALRERVLRFLEIIRLQSILVNAEVMLKGVGTSEFKGKKYLRLRVNSTTTYNLLRLNKYDIGKRLFDETVRKVLNPLNENIAAPKAYFGYDIVVYGHTENFAEKYATADKVEYRFLLPETAVRRYKEKDISGQALLDAGVQLMDDERVELKLQ